MELLHTFTAFDFETASYAWNSVCQLGICRVENSKIVYWESFLIRPPENYYTYRNIAIHGITPDRTHYSPCFPDVWKQVKHLYENELVVAHNASFDMGCLRKTLEYYQLPLPELRVECTYRMSKMKLSLMCERLNIELKKHHDAKYDAYACAMGYLKMKSGVQIMLPKIATEPVIKANPAQYCLNPDSLFYGKRIVFTGVLNQFDRTEASAIVSRIGAKVTTSISRKTDFVIAGAGAGPVKLRKVEEYRNIGYSIKILLEEEFLSVLEREEERS